jgi:hypothetical protein
MPALQIIYRLMTGITNHSFVSFVLIFMHELFATVSLPACAAAPEAERRASPDHRGQDRLALMMPCTDEVRWIEVGGHDHYRHGFPASSSGMRSGLTAPSAWACSMWKWPWPGEG